MSTLLLLIDGNNLAHFLYTNLAPRQKMTPADSLRLIGHLTSYARTYAGQVEVELCLDKSPGPVPDSPGNLRIFAAEYPQTGDDLVTGRFWFHHLHGQGCLVITNDEEILDEVVEAEGSSLRVSDFVRRPGIKDPVLREPDDLPPVPPPAPHTENGRHPLSASIYYRIVEDQRLRRQPGAAEPETRPPAKRAAAQTDMGHAARRSQPRSSGTVPAGTPEPKRLTRDREEKNTSQPETGTLLGYAQNKSIDGEVTPSPGEPYYFLDLNTWPLVEGARFLLKSFCDYHQNEVKDLLHMLDGDTLTHRDLRELAELLLLTCGDEPNFATRGALLARVRLALLQARGEPLSLTQIAGRIGLKAHGLRGRIKAKASPWVGILEDM